MRTTKGPLAQWTVVEAFVRAKTERVDEARSLYCVASELDSLDLVKAVGSRTTAEISAMLATASDARFEDLALTSYIFSAALVGPARAMLEGDAPPKMLLALRKQLESLCLGYITREALPHPKSRRVMRIERSSS